MNPARALGPAVVSGYLQDSHDNIKTHAVSTTFIFSLQLSYRE